MVGRVLINGELHLPNNFNFKTHNNQLDICHGDNPMIEIISDDTTGGSGSGGSGSGGSGSGGSGSGGSSAPLFESPLGKYDEFKGKKWEDIRKELVIHKQDLKPAPYVPDFEMFFKNEPLKKPNGEPQYRLVQVELDVKENIIDVTPGVQYKGLMFSYTAGPLMVCHEGDYIELTLNNKTAGYTHNIDFHASTGALGGGDVTIIKPNESIVLHWRALKAGVFLYHCAPGGVQIPFHMVSGLGGTICIVPRQGLRNEKGERIKLDRALYFCEQDLYVPTDANGNYLPVEQQNQSNILAKMRQQIPTHIMINGACAANAGPNAPHVYNGETVLFIHLQANRDTRPHLIGGHADYWWIGGKLNNPPQMDAETWHVIGGGGGAAVYTFKQPGTYVYVNHNLIEGVLLGAIANVVCNATTDPSKKAKWNGKRWSYADQATEFRGQWRDDYMYPLPQYYYEDSNTPITHITKL
jgi:nitrite reductase (NO-forming)